MGRISMHEYHRRSLKFSSRISIDIGHFDIVINFHIIKGEGEVGGYFLSCHFDCLLDFAAGMSLSLRRKDTSLNIANI